VLQASGTLPTAHDTKCASVVAFVENARHRPTHKQAAIFLFFVVAFFFFFFDNREGVLYTAFSHVSLLSSPSLLIRPQVSHDHLPSKE
jgi:hypothetical protein